MRDGEGDISLCIHGELSDGFGLAGVLDADEGSGREHVGSDEVPDGGLVGEGSVICEVQGDLLFGSEETGVRGDGGIHRLVSVSRLLAIGSGHGPGKLVDRVLDLQGLSRLELIDRGGGDGLVGGTGVECDLDIGVGGDLRRAGQGVVGEVQLPLGVDCDVLLGSLGDLCDLVTGEVCVQIPSEEGASVLRRGGEIECVGVLGELLGGDLVSAVGVVGHRILGVAGGSSLQEEHRTDRGGCHDGDDKYDGDQLFLLHKITLCLIRKRFRRTPPWGGDKRKNSAGDTFLIQ